MRWSTLLVLVGLLLAVPAPESSAQWFGSKKPKTPPQQRVPELFAILKYDKDAGKRADAAEELRQFDGKEFPEIYQYLIEALQGDVATSVRSRRRRVSAECGPFQWKRAKPWKGPGRRCQHSRQGASQDLLDVLADQRLPCSQENRTGGTGRESPDRGAAVGRFAAAGL